MAGQFLTDKIGDHGRNDVVRDLETGNPMCAAPDAQRHARATPARTGGHLGGDFLDQASGQQLGSDRRHRGGADARGLGDVDAGDAFGRTDHIQYLLTSALALIAARRQPS